MTKAIVFISCIFWSSIVCAQDNKYLSNYLITHSTRFETSSTTPDAVIQTKMKGKRLFVLGEIHEAGYNNLVRVKIINSLIVNNKLDKFFIEAGRTMAYINNCIISNKYFLTTPPYYFNLKPGSWWWDFQELNKIIIAQHENRITFSFVGIDFERNYNLYVAINNLFYKQNYSLSSYNKILLDKLEDSSYLKFDEKKFSKFYTQIQKDFYRDSSGLHKELKDNYFEFEYLLGNPNMTGRNDNRNRALAKNIVSEMQYTDSFKYCFLNIGMAHSFPNFSGSTVNILSKTSILKEKIISMNPYSDSVGSPIDSRLFKFMKDDSIRNCFREAAKGKGRFVLFDLSDLSEQYSNIREYCDLLLFIQNDKGSINK